MLSINITWTYVREGVGTNAKGEEISLKFIVRGKIPRVHSYKEKKNIGRICGSSKSGALWRYILCPIRWADMICILLDFIIGFSIISKIFQISIPPNGERTAPSTKYTTKHDFEWHSADIVLRMCWGGEKKDRIPF